MKLWTLLWEYCVWVDLGLGFGMNISWSCDEGSFVCEHGLDNMKRYFMKLGDKVFKPFCITRGKTIIAVRGQWWRCRLCTSAPREILVPSCAIAISLCFEEDHFPLCCQRLQALSLFLWVCGKATPFCSTPPAKLLVLIVINDNTGLQPCCSAFLIAKDLC